MNWQQRFEEGFGGYRTRGVFHALPWACAPPIVLCARGAAAAAAAATANGDWRLTFAAHRLLTPPPTLSASAGPATTDAVNPVYPGGIPNYELLTAQAKAYAENRASLIEAGTMSEAEVRAAATRALELGERDTPRRGLGHRHTQLVGRPGGAARGTG